jgi:hypothetical protein
VSAPDRAAYAARQAQLLDALLRDDELPPGFAAAQAAAAGGALRHKRARAVARGWPALALCLGRAFEDRFDAFVRDAGTAGEPLADGLAFARWIESGGGVLDDGARVEVLLARAALRRRGVWVGAVRLRRPYRRVLVVARLPVRGTVARSVRLGAAGPGW